jgi:hypothetical protein
MRLDVDAELREQGKNFIITAMLFIVIPSLLGIRKGFSASIKNAAHLLIVD